MSHISGTITTGVLTIASIFNLPAKYFIPPYIYGVVGVLIVLIIIVSMIADDIETIFIRRWRNFMHNIKKKRHEMGLGN